MLLGAGEALFAVPIAVQLQDGIQDEESPKLTLVDKMTALCVQLMPAGSYAVLDAYFAAANLLKTLVFPLSLKTIAGSGAGEAGGAEEAEGAEGAEGEKPMVR